jgi:hypothetical protein
MNNTDSIKTWIQSWWTGSAKYPVYFLAEIMGSLLICISKMAISSSQKFLQRFLKEIFYSGVRAFFWGEIFDITPIETSTANFS